MVLGKDENRLTDQNRGGQHQDSNLFVDSLFYRDADYRVASKKLSAAENLLRSREIGLETWKTWKTYFEFKLKTYLQKGNKQKITMKPSPKCQQYFFDVTL